MVVHVARAGQPVVREDFWYWGEMAEAVQAEVPIFEIVAPALINLLSPDPGEVRQRHHLRHAGVLDRHLDRTVRFREFGEVRYAFRDVLPQAPVPSDAFDQTRLVAVHI